VGTEEPAAPVNIGDVVAGKYRIERMLGSGGMGVVVAARHLGLDEPVALKFLALHRADDKEPLERLVREARATFRLRSKHTVRVFDVDELPSGAVYIVMELLEGRDLREELATRGPLPEEEVVSYVLQACDALEEAHGLGIVHRDMKPHNMFLAKQPLGPPIVKLLDFGMSKIDPALFEAGPLTRPETALGTPRYMAPEQWKSASEVDPRADIWALGIVMYELLTGKAPLQGMPPRERQARLLAGAIPSPRDVRTDMSDGLARVIMRCLRADPKGRWPSVVHVAAALRQARPSAAPPTRETEITRTDVTAVVPPQKVARDAIAAMGVPSKAPRSYGPPTRPATPAAMASQGPSGDRDEVPEEEAEARGMTNKAYPPPPPSAPTLSAPIPQPQGQRAPRPGDPPAQRGPSSTLPDTPEPQAQAPAAIRTEPPPPSQTERPPATAKPPSSARPDDFELATEVRAPLFSPADYVPERPGSTLVSPNAGPAQEALRHMAATLRSQDAPPEIAALIAEADARRPLGAAGAAPPTKPVGTTPLAMPRTPPLGEPPPENERTMPMRAAPAIPGVARVLPTTPMIPTTAALPPAPAPQRVSNAPPLSVSPPDEEETPEFRRSGARTFALVVLFFAVGVAIAAIATVVRLLTR
jgi:serine/threonine protein kinase